MQWQKDHGYQLCKSVCLFAVSLHCSKHQVVTASVGFLLYAITKNIIPFFFQREILLESNVFLEAHLARLPLAILGSRSGCYKEEKQLRQVSFTHRHWLLLYITGTRFPNINVKLLLGCGMGVPALTATQWEMNVYSWIWLLIQSAFCANSLVYGCKAGIATSIYVSSSEEVQDLGYEQANRKQLKCRSQLRLDNYVCTCF